MESYIAFLRGINVSGKNLIRMNDLKAVFEKNGCAKVATYLQSGNVVFRAKSKINSGMIEKAIIDCFNLEIPVLIISRTELIRILRKNPFLLKESKNPDHCYVTFLWSLPSKQLVDALLVPANETGRFSAFGNVVYVHCPDGYGRTKINNGFFEKKLRVTATTRNWKTVSALTERVDP